MHGVIVEEPLIFCFSEIMDSVIIVIGDSHQKIVQANLIYRAFSMLVLCGAHDRDLRSYNSSSDWPHHRGGGKKEFSQNFP